MAGRRTSNASKEVSSPKFGNKEAYTSVSSTVVHQPLFQEELYDTAMAFDEAGVPTQQLQANSSRFGRENDDDSMVSGHTANRLVLKENLELVWQKANSISGIRKMNIQFKEERREITS